jgi:RNA polymerase sigma-70 factor (ECF subfamily)
MASESNTTEAEQEQALVSQAIDGDADAFGVLYLDHLDAIYRYIYYRVADEQLAEDLTEEVFVRAWTALPKYEPQGYRFTSWLYRIARNLVVDHYRLPEDQLADHQDYESLANAIKQLGDDEQQVIVLRFMEGLSHREVAEVIGKSEGASRVIQHRALEALVGLMETNE